MLNFIFYMIFSGLEFATVFLLIFSLFNIEYRYYVREALFGTIVATIISYILVVTNLYVIVPMPFIIMIIYSAILKIIFRKKLKYALIISMGSLIAYGLIQWGVVNLAVFNGFVEFGQVNNAFSYNTYVMQTTCIIIGAMIAFFIKLTHGGFGFELRRGRDTSFIVFTLIMFSISSFLSYSNLVTENAANQYAILCSLVISTTIFFIMSYNRDYYEIKL